MIALIPALLLAGAAQAAAAEPVVVYTAKAGDNLYTLGARYFDRMSDVATVQRLNRIANPYRIPVGTRIRIPHAVLRQSAVPAKVAAFSGPVSIGAPGKLAPAVLGMTVNEADRIETGERGHATLRLADGSLVSIPSQSAVQIARMRQTALIGSVDRLFTLSGGGLRARVTPMTNGESRFRVSTPTAVAAVRGTMFATSYDPATQATLTGVTEGKVELTDAASHRMLALPTGFGAHAGDEAPHPLLAAPELVDGGRIQNQPRLAFAVKPEAGANGYALSIARDAGFIDVLDEARSATPEASFDSLPTGTYFVRAAVIDASGIEGMASTYGFQRRLNSLSASVEGSGKGRRREYLFRWTGLGDGAHQYRFQLSTHADGSQPMIDRIGLTGDRLIVTDLPVGDYYWRVMSVQFADGQANGAWAATETLHIEARD
ncbi:MAG: peptidoglycan-binding protein [Sphingomonas sanxanigenens]|uniref:Peptidoglycan-binding protein n=1 Tax=Sphingomonas sanxanigenens TaxID=397260 RepID=A0A2W5AAW6_9SPHN|nr:MAG: peptidoglycan-binding protein [Sphingomonas sanxanigenens]